MKAQLEGIKLKEETNHKKTICEREKRNRIQNKNE